MNRTDRINNALQFATEHRLVQGAWHKTAEDGRELACMLGALGGDIRSPGGCPADVMPEWLACLLVPMFDGCGDRLPSEYPARFYRALSRLPADDSALWRRVQVDVLLASLRIALPHDRRNVVQPVIDLLEREQRGDTPSPQEYEAAAEAAWAAAKAAAEAAKAAAKAAAEAAKAAAKAAKAAAKAAEEAAWASIFTAPIDAMEREAAAKAAAEAAWASIFTAPIDAMEREAAAAAEAAWASIFTALIDAMEREAEGMK